MIYILPTIEVKDTKSQILNYNLSQLALPYGNSNFKRTDFNVYYKVLCYLNEKNFNKLGGPDYVFTIYPNKKVFKSLPLKKEIYMNYNEREKLKKNFVGKFTYTNVKVEDMINSKVSNIKELGWRLVLEDIINSEEV